MAEGAETEEDKALRPVLVDTDVVSYLLNRHSLAAAYELLLADRTPFVSFMTVAEMYRGAAKRNWGAARLQELERHLRGFVIVPYDVAICIAYGQLCAAAERKGRPVATADALIAACAMALRIPLVTNNRRHFEVIDGLELITADRP